MTAPAHAFDVSGQARRRDAFFACVRANRQRWFAEDGTYGPDTEADRRISFWILPAFLHSPDPQERAFGLRLYLADPTWSEWNVFQTSIIAANLVRERKRLSPEAISRSEDHLARFVSVAGGRQPCSAANDYVFHGYNDNMPAMATRTMILAGDVLGRHDLTDRGLFHLEGLCAHFHRRGLLSEHTSATYTPITLTALMDIAEGSTNPEARGMALACARRVLLDVFGFFHHGTGTLAGAQSRAYTKDLAASGSEWNALVWYLTGHPLLVDPREPLSELPFPGPIHHGRCQAFNAAAHCEPLTPDYTDIGADLIAWARAERPAEYRITGTTDLGSAALTGPKGATCRAYHRPLWGLGTQSDTWFDHAGQQNTLYASLATTPAPRSWHDRVTLFHRLRGDQPAQGNPVVKTSLGTLAESDDVGDWGHWRTAQKDGTALVVGSLGPALLGQRPTRLALEVLLGTWLNDPAECWEDEHQLSAWPGECSASAWQFVRFGDCYLGLRLAGMNQGRVCPARRVVEHGYHRVEVPLWEGSPTEVSDEQRRWSEVGYVLELGDRERFGDFARFRAACRSGRWEWHHPGYRTVRYLGHAAELQIVDSVADHTVRFIAIDGVVENSALLAANGLDPALVRLFADDRRVAQRRLMYDPGFITTPFSFYPQRCQTVVCDEVPALPPPPMNDRERNR